MPSSTNTLSPCGIASSIRVAPGVRSARALGRVVRRAGQQDRRIVRALRDHDHGVEPPAVAHRDHLDPLHEIARSGALNFLPVMSGVIGATCASALPVAIASASATVVFKTARIRIARFPGCSIRQVLHARAAMAGQLSALRRGRGIAYARRMTVPVSPAGLTRPQLKTLALASLGGALEALRLRDLRVLRGHHGRAVLPARHARLAEAGADLRHLAAATSARLPGGIVMAHFGDLSGRKKMFMLSILLMAIPTLLMGLLPTYATAGVLAPILLLLLRIMQGAAIGGEAPARGCS